MNRFLMWVMTATLSAMALAITQHHVSISRRAL
jgi:hypothetical protein